MRKYYIEQEPEWLEVHLVQDGEKIAGALVDIEPGGITAAYRLAHKLGAAFGTPAGDGEVSSPYRPH